MSAQRKRKNDVELGKQPEGTGAPARTDLPHAARTASARQRNVCCVDRVMYTPTAKAKRKRSKSTFRCLAICFGHRLLQSRGSSDAA